MIAGYRGYAAAQRVLVLGRVLRDPPVEPGKASASWWRNLIDTLRRIGTEPVPHATVRVRVGTIDHEISADEEGYLHAWIPIDEPLPSPGWHEVHLDVTQPADLSGPSVRAHVLAPTTDAAFGVISDLDDTVLQSNVGSFLRAARLILLENACTRLPFPGVAAFYRALERGTGTGSGPNPIFYVSSSPWNLYDVIVDFLATQSIPIGPVLLRDWDLGPSILRNREHKATLIREVLASYPSLPFILVGDTTQEDPEIYSDIVREYPERIRAVYIRNVDAHPERRSSITALAEGVALAGSTLVLADDTLAAARHAAEHGWIDPASLEEIAHDKASDEGRTGEKIEAPGVETPSAPTIVVDENVGADQVQ